VEKMSSESTEKITEALASGMDAEVEGPSGLTFPGYFGLIARRYMEKYGMTVEQMGKVSVKNHNNSVLNPRARFRNRVTLEQVMNSAVVADPIKLYDSCPISDGAAALILCASNLARKFTDKAVEIIGSAQTLGYNSICDLEDITNLPATALAGKQAYKMAKIGPEDIDVVELHDCFTIAEIVDSEDLGFFERGRGFIAVEEGQTEIGGKVAISPSGGLLSKGHPVGATGCGQIFEVVKQLRGEHENQVKGAEIGLTHNVGAGAVCTVHILRRR
jgi:acetyl-CoA C-acetyltransferase